MRLGAVEINECNVVCAVGNDSGEIMYKKIFDICSPDSVIDIINEYFNGKNIKGFGMVISSKLNKNFVNFNWKESLQKFITVPISINNLNENSTILQALIFARKVS